MPFGTITTLKEDQVLTEAMIDSINQQTVYWSDDRLCHWFFDYTCDGHWISAWEISNDFKTCVVDIWEGTPSTEEG